jgi:hypothetical protein
MGGNRMNEKQRNCFYRCVSAGFLCGVFLVMAIMVSLWWVIALTLFFYGLKSEITEFETMIK